MTHSTIKWPPVPTRKPTPKEMGRYQRWLKYLANSKLSKAEQHSRAQEYAAQGREPDDS